MTREEALRNLNLPPEADAETIEKAYQRLVRRYPPEFHPDKFRTIDESYRHLTSLPAMLELLLSPSVEEVRLDPELFSFSPSVAETRIDEALAEIRAVIVAETLWRRSSPGRAKKGKIPF